LAGSQYCDECGEFLSSAPSIEANGNGVNAAPKPVSFLSDGPDSQSLSKQTSVVPAAEAPAPDNLSLKPSPSQAKPDLVARMEGAHAKLVIERGRSSGKQFPLSSEEAQIGRWDADGGVFPDVDLDADDPEAKVSRRHARIVRRSGQYLIEDLGSTNGTFINRGRRLLPGDRQPLRDGDEIIVGKTFLRFHLIH
jgi:hypothetical protein